MGCIPFYCRRAARGASRVGVAHARPMRSAAPRCWASARAHTRSNNPHTFLMTSDTRTGRAMARAAPHSLHRSATRVRHQHTSAVPMKLHHARRCMGQRLSILAHASFATPGRCVTSRLDHVGIPHWYWFLPPIPPAPWPALTSSASSMESSDQATWAAR